MKNEKLIALLPLETERLIIKPTSVDDIDMILKMDKQEVTQKFLGGVKNKTREERIKFLEKKASKFADNIAGSLTVYLKESNTPIGFTGLSINEDDNNAKFFFMWIKSAIKDFGSLLGEHNFEYGSVVRKMFGEQKLKDFGYDKKYNLVPPTPIKVESQNKPWLEYGY